MDGGHVERLPQLVVLALRDHHKQQLEDRLPPASAGRAPDYPDGRTAGFVFTSGVGTVLEPRNVNRYFDRIRERAGLGEHTFHGLRHDFAGRLLGYRTAW